MVIGLRIGLLALRELDSAGWFDLACRVRLEWRPPDSCVIDGIQTSTGCSMGKHNIEVEQGEGISAVFTKADKSIRITLRREVLRDLRSVLAENDEVAAEKQMMKLIDASDHDLFKVS